MNDVKTGWGVERGFNGDCYPYYIVDIERGKYSYNKDRIVGLWIVSADATCEGYYNSKWNVESFDPAKHTKEKAFYIKATRNHPCCNKVKTGIMHFVLYLAENTPTFLEVKEFFPVFPQRLPSHPEKKRPFS